MTPMVPMTLRAQTTHECKLRGNAESTTSMSFEKRFMMRPIGVLSKNDIGARSPLFKIDVCSSVAERSIPSASTNAEQSTKIPVVTTEPNTFCNPPIMFKVRSYWPFSAAGGLPILHQVPGLPQSVHTAMAQKKFQSTWCYSVELTIRLGRRQEPILR